MNKIFDEIKTQLTPSENAFEKLSKSIENIEKENVEQKKGDKKRFVIPAVCTAAVACVAVAVGFGVNGSLSDDQTGLATTNQAFMTEIATEPAIEDFQEDCVAVIKRWDEMTDSERYVRIVDGDANEYGNLSISGKTDSAKIGKSLGNVVLEGYDMYTDTVKTVVKEAFEVDGISTDCAMAVKHDDEYYIYENHSYEFETLGDLVNTLNLRENLTFGNIHHDYFDEDMTYHMITYAPIESEVIWDMLLSDLDIKNEGDTHYGADVMGISISSDVLGFSNISLAVNEDGYLQTNIFATGKSFYIGKDKVQAFVDYVSKNGEITAENTIVNEPIVSGGEGMSSPGYNPDEVVPDEVVTTYGEGVNTPAYEPIETVTMISQAYNPQTIEE